VILMNFVKNLPLDSQKNVVDLRFFLSSLITTYEKSCIHFSNKKKLFIDNNNEKSNIPPTYYKDPKKSQIF